MDGITWREQTTESSFTLSSYLWEKKVTLMSVFRSAEKALLALNSQIWTLNEDLISNMVDISWKKQHKAPTHTNNNNKKKERRNANKILSYAGKKKLTLRQAETLSEVFFNTTKEPFHLLLWMECNFSAVAAISKKSWNTHYLLNQHILRDRLLQPPIYNDRMWRVTLRKTGLERWLPQERARDQTLRPGWIFVVVD